MEITDVFRRVDDTLVTARFGFEDLRGAADGRRKLAGLRNLVVFGRAVTNVLQNFRSVVPDFDEWYAPKQEEMRGDPLLRHFYELRTEILKKGIMKTAGAIHIKALSIPADLKRFGPPPPGASVFFIGDEFGGTGWEVHRDGGQVEKYYVVLPADIGTVSLLFPDPPAQHLGRSLPRATVDEMCELYLTYLERLVAEAKVRFAGL